MTTKEKRWILIVLILAGLVLGGLLGHLTKDVEGLSWLNYGKTFGLMEPLKLNLEVIELTFALIIRLNVASIIGILLGIFIYTRI